MSGGPTPSDERELRKAWLKQLFLSHGYYEQLLRDYTRWLELLEQHWNSEKMRTDDPGRADVMVEQVLPRLHPGSLLETTPSPYTKSKDGSNRAAASSILYNFNKGMQYLIDNPYSGMSGDVETESYNLTQEILWAAENILTTCEGRWSDKPEGNDDDILDERYTGPIDWPPHWKDDLHHGPRAILS